MFVGEQGGKFAEALAALAKSMWFGGSAEAVSPLPFVRAVQQSSSFAPMEQHDAQVACLV